MKNKKLRNLVISASAGKAALVAGTASGQECLDLPNSAVAGDSSLFAAAGSTLSSGGKGGDSTTVEANTLYTRALAADSVLTVTVSGLDSSATDLYIAYSPTKVNSSQVGTACNGDLLLDTGSMKILEGFTLNRSRNMGFGATPLGTLAETETAATTQLDLVLNLDDMLTDPSLETNEVYLQAVSFPASSTDISLASVSPILQITLDRENLPGETTDNSDSGDNGGTGSKSS